MRGLSAAVVLVCLAIPVAAFAADPGSRSFVDVRIDSPDQLQKLAEEQFDIAGFDAVAGNAGVIATEHELARLRELGFVYWLRETREPGEGIEALSQYSDPQELSAAMDQVVANHPDLARKLLLEDTLFEGQKLYALHITKDVGEPNDRPSFILDAQHHAREVMTAEIARDAMVYLTSRYATDPQVQRWLDNINIYIVPTSNPDGAMYVFQHDSWWRKNRHPDCPVDLNRNYPFFWGACYGSSGSCSSDTNRGPTPASEPETQALIALTAEVRPFFALSYHSYGEYLMYSYGCTDPDERAAMHGVAQALNAILPNDQGQTGQFRTGPIFSTIYSADGGSVDTQYGDLGAYAYVIEVNQSSFQPDYNTWRTVTVQRQRVAWRYFLDKTLDAPQIRGKVTDAYTGEPLAATVSVAEVTFTHGESARQADARGLYHWLAQAGNTYNVSFALPGYCTATHTVTVGDGPQVVDVQLGHPPAPAGIAAEPAGDGRIRVSWQGVDEATEYHVYRALDTGGPYAQVGAVAAPTCDFVDEGLSGDVPYHYVVRAFHACESPDSPAASATTSGPCTLPPSFAGAGAVANNASETCTLLVSWPAAAPYCAGPVSYRVYRSATAPFAPGPANLVAAGLAGTSYADHSALASEVPYHYIVRAVDAASGAEDANTVTRSATPTGPLAPGTWRDDAGDSGSARMELAAPWSVQPTGGNLQPLVYATGTYGNSICAALTSPAIHVQSGSVLSFAAKYDIETDYDAGVVEVASGPAFTDWTPLAVNYPDRLRYSGNQCGIPTSTTNTVFSRSYATPAYAAGGYSGALAAYAGQEVKLRFRLGTDGGSVGAGWWIDEIAVSDALIPAACTSGVPPTPQEVGAPGAPISCAAAGTGIEVRFAPACGALDTAAYWGAGPIAGGPQWSGAACGLGTSGRGAFDPGDPGPGGLVYFVLVGQDGQREGSYGRSSAGLERPEASGVGACDLPQELGGSCP
ncbi:MAG: immune inhibitor A [Acidobacteria bacterium]|nr:immune inhibitor A [Acidobacteriota bacterium]